MRTKLPAYTMIELIAVMLLSGLIFSMALLVIQIMNQQQKHQEIEHTEVLQVEQLRTLLKKDAYQAKAMFVEDKQLFFDYVDYTIKYKFEELKVLRHIIESRIHTDTFFLPTNHFEAQWKGQHSVAGICDEVQWKSQFFQQVFEINLQKKYDNKTMMDLEVREVRD